MAVLVLPDCSERKLMGAARLQVLDLLAFLSEGAQLGEHIPSRALCLLLGDVVPCEVDDALVIRRATSTACAAVKHGVTVWDVIHGCISQRSC